jgi:proteasome lid subunit RPN8/RPN11
VQPVDNIDEQPHIRFTMDPQRQLQIILDFEQQKWEVVGIYHSHPQGYARPSATDIAELTYPDAVYLIGVPQGELTAWRIIKGTVQPVLIEIVT